MIIGDSLPVGSLILDQMSFDFICSYIIRKASVGLQHIFCYSILFQIKKIEFLNEMKVCKLFLKEKLKER